MVRYILEEASSECSTELRTVISMSKEQQAAQHAATEGKMFSEACAVEINGKATEFQQRLQAGEILPEMGSGSRGGSGGGDESFDDGGEYEGGGGGGGAPPAPVDTRSSAPIVAIVFLSVTLVLGALGFVAWRRHAAFEKELASDPAKRAQYEKWLKKKSKGGE